MADDRDYAGMYEIEPGVFAMRVHIYEDDAQMQAMKAKMAALEEGQGEMKALAEKQTTYLANIQTLLVSLLTQARNGVKTKETLSIDIVGLPPLASIG